MESMPIFGPFPSHPIFLISLSNQMLLRSGLNYHKFGACSESLRNSRSNGLHSRLGLGHAVSWCTDVSIWLTLRGVSPPVQTDLRTTELKLHELHIIFCPKD